VRRASGVRRAVDKSEDFLITFKLLIVFSYSILLAAAVGVVRYRRVTADNRPFFYIVWIALINELLSEILTSTIHSTAVNCNIYVLTEAVLYCWLFYNWGSWIRTKKRFRLLFIFLCSVWILDNVILNSLRHTNSIFRVVSSFVLVFLAIDQINQLITMERSKLLTNARFLISMGVVIFFTYRAIIETFYGIRLPFSGRFYYNVYLIMSYVNLFVNLIFTLAVIWIPTRQKFILPS
jgi:hypothetical protein